MLFNIEAKLCRNTLNRHFYEKMQLLKCDVDPKYQFSTKIMLTVFFNFESMYIHWNRVISSLENSILKIFLKKTNYSALKTPNGVNLKIII